MRFLILLLAVFSLLVLCFSNVQGVEAASLSGRMLMKNGMPVSEGIAVVFDLQDGLLPAPAKYFRLPDYVEDIQSDGSFNINLPKGMYAIGGVKRKDGKVGPPREGDVFFLLRDEQNNLKRIVIPENGNIILGDLFAGEIFRPVSDPVDSITSVSGKITDTQGKPVKGVIVVAVLIRKGSKEMFFLSQEADDNGEYILQLPFGETYKLGIWEIGSPDEASKKINRTITITTGEMLNGFDFKSSF